MRGLAMVMVVVGHIFTLCFDYTPIYNDLISIQFQIPLFFFISGFFAKTVGGGKKELLRLIAHRFMLLVTPAIIVMSLYCWIFKYNIINGMFSTFKLGYWFTFVLFGFVSIHMCTDLIIRKFTSCTRTRIVLHLIFSILVCYSALIYGKYSEYMSFLNYFSYSQYFNYPYFILGSIMFAHRDRIFTYLEKHTTLIGMLIILYILSTTVTTLYGHKFLSYSSGLVMISTTTIGIALIWYVFHTDSRLSTGSPIGRSLTLIGKRTLDVYFLHYFFLPFNLSEWGDYFSYLNAPFIAYVCGILLAIPVILASLGVGYIIRLSPFSGRLILSAKSSGIKNSVS